jgi:hypothetical protein
MLADPGRVIVTTEEDPVSAVPVSSVHHCAFPEVRGEGPSPSAAAARLADLLSRSLDNAPSDWRRAPIERAIEDVRAFAVRERPELSNVRRASPGVE